MGTEWTLPNLRRLDLGGQTTTHITVKYDRPSRCGVEAHRISVRWTDRRRVASAANYRDRGVLMWMSKANVLFLDGKDRVNSLHIVAPTITEMHLKGCEALRKLVIESRILTVLVFENCHASILKMVKLFPETHPWLKRITLEV